ncbi:MAG: GH25 family lysozyme [Pirellulales bacterium]
MSRLILTVMLRTLIVLAALPIYGDQVRAQFIEGIDVSHWQGTINWNSVKNAGIDFAFAKATQSNNFVDSRFHDNMQAATTAGVLIGPYHFADVDTDINNPLDPVNEANHFLDVIGPFYDSGMYLPPVADVEGLPDFPTIAEERAFISNWVQVFSDTINDSLGVRPFIYSSKWSANTYYTSSVASTHDPWLAWWKGTGTTDPPIPSDTPLWNDWKFWQYTSSGSVSGISGNVDRDVFHGTQQELDQLAIGTEPDDNDNLVMITNFDANEGYFQWSTGFSGSNQGIGPDSSAERVTSEAFEGIGSQEIFVDGDPDSWFYRHLSGLGTPVANPATNLALEATGNLGFWLKTDDPGISVQIAVDDPNTGDRGISKDVIADSQWHLYQWELEDDLQWEAWVNEEGIITGPTVTIDSIQFRGAGAATIYLDSVAHNPIGSLLPLPGDFNQDRDVDGDDLSTWQSDFGTASDATTSNGDADGDSKVDGADFLIWQRNLTPVSRSSNSIGVPEPGALWLMVCMICRVVRACTRQDTGIHFDSKRRA